MEVVPDYHLLEITKLRVMSKEEISMRWMSARNAGARKRYGAVQQRVDLYGQREKPSRHGWRQPSYLTASGLPSKGAATGADGDSKWERD